MKIAMLMKNFTTTGGSNRYAVELSSRLRQRGHDVHVFAQGWDASLIEGLVMHPVQSLARPRYLNALFYAWQVDRLLKGESFDVVHSHQRTINHDVISMHHPCYTIHRPGRPPAGRLLTLFKQLFNPRHLVYRWLESRQFGCHSLKYVVAVSEGTKRDILSHYPLDVAMVRVIYPGVDVEGMSMERAEEKRRAVRQQCGISDDELVLVLVGTAFKRKGLRYAIEALHRLDRHGDGRSVPHLFVVGGGHTEGFREQAEHYGLGCKVHFIGLSNSVQQFYNAADLLVLPTLNEPFGMVVLEAMVAGLPVVVSRAAGVTEVLQDGEEAILLDDPRDVEQIASAVRQLRNDGDRTAMGRRARETAEKFTWDRMTEEIERLYEEVRRVKGRA